jgi:hypothetical protein
MAFGFSNCSRYNNFRSSIYSCMVKQKLELNFIHGVVIGVILTASIMSVVIDKMFVSRDVFKLKRIYVNGKIFKLCEDR